MLLIEFCPNYLSPPHLDEIQENSTTSSGERTLQAGTLGHFCDRLEVSFDKGAWNHPPPSPSRQCPNRQGDIYKSGSRRVLEKLNFQRTAAYIIIYIYLGSIFPENSEEEAQLFIPSTDEIQI